MSTDAKAADQFQPVHRSGYGDRLAFLMQWLTDHPDATLASGEGRVLRDEIVRLRACVDALAPDAIVPPLTATRFAVVDARGVTYDYRLTHRTADTVCAQLNADPVYHRPSAIYRAPFAVHELRPVRHAPLDDVR
jgi:hypothetical protein